MTLKQKYQNFNVLKKIMSWDDDDKGDYAFDNFKNEHGNKKEFSLIIKPDNDKQYNEIIKIMPYKLEINGNK